ncbi:MAG TPA: DegT/DnrJ/EryC1/StrS family aminotransferase [Candidatus Limnocylindria bacterium]|jgi:dTDP-4-amino-4,6-dideoxygalactose transaminase|nr:DegT/DnrJ/EryC1/StrS family aminotransferase [Candidatus Limnocylindria bacterium]
MDKIPVFKPLLEAEEFEATTEALRLGWLGMGKYVGDFEQAVLRLLETEDRHAVAVSTGHAALHLALLLIGVGPGDEVITPAFNNIADFQAILATGASPVFCDIDEDTLCIDLQDAEALVGPRTKAIIVMDYDCVLCDHDEVARFAQRHNLRVIHDAAHAFGSRQRGRVIGSFSDIAMFSFDPVKTITSIDGGMLIVRTKEEVSRLHQMRLIGMGQPASVMYQNQRAWTYDVTQLGFRYHLANLHGALGLAQLAKLPVISSTRRETCLRYNAELSSLAEVTVPKTDFEDITPFLYYIRVPAGRRDALRAFLTERGIDTGIHWQPGHWFTLFKDCRRSALTVTDRVGHEVLSLPLHSKMSVEFQQRVIDGIKAFFS